MTIAHGGRLLDHLHLRVADLEASNGEEGSMYDHVGLNIRDYAASRTFYEQALAPLGYHVVMAFDEWRAVGFGPDQKPEFWISQREPFGTGTHVAFACDDRATVDAFHEVALAAGALDNGAPGVREMYHPTYYSAFVHDLDGNNIEAVCHSPG